MRLIKVAIGDRCFSKRLGPCRKDLLQRELHLNDLTIQLGRNPDTHLEHPAEITVAASDRGRDLRNPDHAAALMDHFHTLTEQCVGLILKSRGIRLQILADAQIALMERLTMLDITGKLGAIGEKGLDWKRGICQIL